MGKQQRVERAGAAAEVERSTSELGPSRRFESETRSAAFNSVKNAASVPANAIARSTSSA